ncbi:MFS transporter [Litorilituus lipolyticus]|uniref:MFS transporter n=1 Tax=Litorilituus lipolyticus TaxID=2491017 RepID=A0A502L4T2_9GAMM|nr:MFS transporter [Litorilituus lipolyticus]TPH17949.1 MFS transporter [Litorilituus lipolyticus]
MSLFTRLSTSYFFYFALLGLVTPFLSVFLDGKGFNSLEVGEILAIITATKIIAPSLWAMLADKSGRQLAIIQLGALLALISFIFLYWLDAFWPITLSLALFSLFWTAILPQLEVLTLTSVRRSGKIYARIRLWGSLGFIALAILTGEVISAFSYQAFITVGCLLLISLLISTLMLKQPVQGQSKSITQATIFAKLFKLPFIVFFVAGILLQISFGPYYSFFALYLRDMGYPGYAVGLLISLGVLAEIIIFILAGKLFKYFNVKGLLFISLFVTSIRWYISGNYGDTLWLLTLSQLFHAASFAVYHSASMQFLSEYFNSAQQGRGQAIYLGGVYGLGGAIGAYIAGLLWLDGAGATHSFNVAALSALVGAMILLLLPNSSLSRQQ